MDEQTTPGDRSSPRAPAIPWPVWLLVAGAVVQLGVRIAPDSYQVFGPYLLVTGDMIIEWMRSVSIFLLAAAVVLAAGRWPAGRRQLQIAAAALAVVALIRMADGIWFAIWEASGHAYELSQPWLFGGFVVSGFLFVTANALLAAGLWTARHHRRLVRVRAALVAVVGLGGLVATAAGIWVVARTLGSAPVDYFAYSVATTILTAAGFAALALVALAAVRVAPHPGGLPESLIAVGAMVSMAGSAWAWTRPYFTSGAQEVSEEAFFWVFTLPNAAAAVGMLTMVAGFALGASARGRRVQGDPAA